MKLNELKKLKEEQLLKEEGISHVLHIKIEKPDKTLESAMIPIKYFKYFKFYSQTVENNKIVTNEIDYTALESLPDWRKIFCYAKLDEDIPENIASKIYSKCFSLINMLYYGLINSWYDYNI